MLFPVTEPEKEFKTCFGGTREKCHQSDVSLWDSVVHKTSGRLNESGTHLIWSCSTWRVCLSDSCRQRREETVWWFLTLSDWTKARPSPMTQMPNWQDWLYDDLNTLSSNLPSPCRRSAHMWSNPSLRRRPARRRTRDVTLALQYTEGEEQSQAFLPRRPSSNMIRADDYRDDYNHCHRLRRRRPPEIIKEIKSNLSLWAQNIILAVQYTSGCFYVIDRKV